MNCSADAPLIMLGCQHSGTSLAATLLAAHPQGGFGSELGVIRFSLIWFRRLCDCQPAFRNLRMVEFLHAFRRVGGEQGAGPHQRIFANLQRVLMRQIRTGQLEAWAEQEDVDGFIRNLCFETHTFGLSRAEFWGDEYPEYLFHLDELEGLFPNARYLYLYRHPQDVMESLFRHRNNRRGFTGGLRFTMEDCREQWVSWNQLWHDFNSRIPPERRLETAFEELARNPRETLATWAEFLGTNLLDSAQLRLLAQQVDAGQIGKWLQMPDAQRVLHCPPTAALEELCESYGYELAGEAVQAGSGDRAHNTQPPGEDPLPDPPPDAPGDIDAPGLEARALAESAAIEPRGDQEPASEAQPSATVARATSPAADSAALTLAAQPPESSLDAESVAAISAAPENAAAEEDALPPPPPAMLQRAPVILPPESVVGRPKIELLVIGLDGMTPNVLFDELPRLDNFKALVGAGLHGELQSVSPPMSGCAWPSFFTGLAPAHHGFDENERRFEDMSYLDVRATKVWEMLNRAGISTGFLNMPLAYQVDPLQGYIVPGRFAPLRRMTPQVRNTLQGYRAHPRIAPQTTAEFLREQWDTDRQCVHYWEKLVRAHPTDLATIVLYTPDNVGHWFWDDASAVHDSYALLDQLLGRMLNSVQAKNVIVMSDHGMRGQHEQGTEEFAQVLDGKGETVHHQMSGWHQKAGIYVAAGQAFSQGAEQVPINLVDLTPVMLRLFGVEANIRFDGAVPEGLFAELVSPSAAAATARDTPE